MLRTFPCVCIGFTVLAACLAAVPHASRGSHDNKPFDFPLQLFCASPDGTWSTAPPAVGHTLDCGDNYQVAGPNGQMHTCQKEESSTCIALANICMSCWKWAASFWCRTSSVVESKSAPFSSRCKYPTTTSLVTAAHIPQRTGKVHEQWYCFTSKSGQDIRLAMMFQHDPHAGSDPDQRI